MMGSLPRADGFAAAATGLSTKRADLWIGSDSGTGAAWGQFDGGADFADYRTRCASRATGRRKRHPVEEDHRALPYPAGFDRRLAARTRKAAHAAGSGSPGDHSPG